MKVYKEIIAKSREINRFNAEEQEAILWQLLCYAPKMPLRKNQEELMEQATLTVLQVPDTYFSGDMLNFNVFKWGEGDKVILLTHGWSAKAADFAALITLIGTLENTTVIAFDAPGNGSSAGALSNLLLYTEALRQIYQHFGKPGILIGHSLGAMANIMSLEENGFKPDLLISIAPVINLKSLFMNMMDAVSIPVQLREEFFEKFFDRFKRPASAYDLTTTPLRAAASNHWIAYDNQDAVVNTAYLKKFLKRYPQIQTTSYNGAGHEKLIRREELLEELMQQIRRIYPAMDSSEPPY